MNFNLKLSDFEHDCCLCRLKQLLYSEEQQYERELENLAETPLERAAKLREKARNIKEEREREKQQFVTEMLDQKWRLFSFLSLRYLPVLR